MEPPKRDMRYTALLVVPQRAQGTDVENRITGLQRTYWNTVGCMVPHPCACRFHVDMGTVILTALRLTGSETDPELCSLHEAEHPHASDM